MQEKGKSPAKSQEKKNSTNRRGEFFGMDGLMNTLGRISRSEEVTEEILHRLRQAVETFREGCEPFDDLAVLALFLKEAPHSKEGGEEGMVSIPVALSSFDEIKQRLFEVAGDTEKTRQALVACDEVLSNIVHYSGATKVFFGCKNLEDALQVIFMDNGVAFDPTTAKVEEKDFESLDSGGMGLTIIRESVSSMRYEREDGRNRLFLSFLSEA